MRRARIRRDLEGDLNVTLIDRAQDIPVNVLHAVRDAASADPRMVVVVLLHATE